jgi:hypothetical protein
MTNKQLYSLCGVILLSASFVASSPVLALVSLSFLISSIAEDTKKP